MKNFNKEILLLIGITLVILSIVFIFVKTNQPEKVCIESKSCFVVEIADSEEERRTGLSNKDSIEEDEGMLFTFQEEEFPGFWMKDMNFSIDIIWISSDMKIIGIERNIQPCGQDSCLIFYPQEKIKYVLEINSGMSERYGFEEGDSVYLR